jgi:hypothetical protein
MYARENEGYIDSKSIFYIDFSRVLTFQSFLWISLSHDQYDLEEQDRLLLEFGIAE